MADATGWPVGPSSSLAMNSCVVVAGRRASGPADRQEVPLPSHPSERPNMRMGSPAVTVADSGWSDSCGRDVVAATPRAGAPLKAHQTSGALIATTTGPPSGPAICRKQGGPQPDGRITLTEYVQGLVTGGMGISLPVAQSRVVQSFAMVHVVSAGRQ